MRAFRLTPVVSLVGIIALLGVGLSHIVVMGGGSQFLSWLRF